MGEDQQEKVPKVFISYSHDSLQHKNWVAELAAKLVDKGIDVALDRWDLRRGGDVPKYMERSVGWADRVLMICTEAYVRKADEGKGGVGYEAMIVTGEFIRDLGTTKFIPIIRQSDGKAEVPKFMGTRFYLNLSEGQKFEEEFEELLRELHDEPALKKPSIGKNPFAKTPGGKEVPAVEIVLTAPPPVPLASVDLKTATIFIPEPNYQNALGVARSGDSVVWRRLIQKAQSLIPENLAAWRKRWERGDLTNEEAIPMCLDGIRAYEPLIAVALAGVESGRDGMKSQMGLIDELLSPKNWSRAGFTVIGDFPYTAAFTYQALHGALCLETQQLDLAINLAKTRVQHPDNYERSGPLYHEKKMIGWPSSLLGHARVGWEYLRKLPETFPWLNEVFMGKEKFEAALCAYYLALNTLELADVIAQQNEGILAKSGVRLEIPLCALFVSAELRPRAYSLFMRDAKQVRRIWEDLAVPEAKMREHWSRWIELSDSWIADVSRGDFWGSIPHKGLFEDLSKRSA